MIERTKAAHRAGLDSLLSAQIPCHSRGPVGPVGRASLSRWRALGRSPGWENLVLRERKERLRHLLSNTGMLLQYSNHQIGRGPESYDKACEFSLEGIISKRADAPYSPGNRGLWVKVKCQNREEFVVVAGPIPKVRVLGSGRCSWRITIPTGGSFMPDASELALTMRSSAGFGGCYNRSPLPGCRSTRPHLGRTDLARPSPSAACIGCVPSSQPRSSI